MHDEGGMGGGRRRPGVGGHIGHAQQNEFSAEDLLVTRERVMAIAGKREIGLKRHGGPPPRCSCCWYADCGPAGDSSAPGRILTTVTPPEERYKKPGWFTR